MSYDIKLCYPDHGEVIELSEPHHMTGGTYQAGGTTRAWLNITYNYGDIFRRVLGEKGIRTVYGMGAADSLPLLEKACEALGDDMGDSYWDATEGNAKRALQQLMALAKLRPDGVWQGD